MWSFMREIFVTGKDHERFGRPNMMRFLYKYWHQNNNMIGMSLTIKGIPQICQSASETHENNEKMSDLAAQMSADRNSHERFFLQQPT